MARLKVAFGLVSLALVLPLKAQIGLSQANDLSIRRVVTIEAQNESFDHEVESLLGLKRIRILVMTPFVDAIQDGLTEGNLRAEIDSRLLQGGIEVLRGEDSQRSGPYLFVNARTAKNHEDDTYVWNIEVSVMQNVRLDHDPNALLRRARIWSRGGFGSGPTNDMSRTIVRAVGRYVNSFVQDYQSVNPRP